jgi:hypothetical protein
MLEEDAKLTRGTHLHARSRSATGTRKAGGMGFQTTRKPAPFQRLHGRTARARCMPGYTGSKRSPRGLADRLHPQERWRPWLTELVPKLTATPAHDQPQILRP